MNRPQLARILKYMVEMFEEENKTSVEEIEILDDRGGSGGFQVKIYEHDRSKPTILEV